VHRVTLGSTGLQVSRLCLGGMQFGWTADEEQSFAVLDAYAEAGGNFIDTANVYSRWVPGHYGGESEEIIGRWMKARGNRNRMVIATKVRGRMWDGEDGEGLSPMHIFRAAEDSLKRLQVDTIDLYQAHWFDEKMPITRSLRGFEDLVRNGRVRFVGVSNFPADRLLEGLEAADKHDLPRFETIQPHHSLVHRYEFEETLQGLALDERFGVIPYSPLAGGFLTGKYTRGGPPVASQRAAGVRQYFSEEGWAVLDVVRAIAGSHASTPAAVVLAWQMAQPAITAPIIGANTPEQLEEQLAALSLILSDDELARLTAVSRPFRELPVIQPAP
jgi:aryl-alcohol dehydrogenase-like predicted oxidoreductase